MKTKQLIITILMITFVTMITTKVEATENDEQVEQTQNIENIEKDKQYNLTKEVKVKTLPLIFAIEKETIPSGNIRVTDILNDWCKIENEGKSGWIRINTIKSNIEEIKQKLDVKKIEYEEVKWSKEAIIIKNEDEKAIQEMDIYTNGEIYMQSLSSMLPPIILEPKEDTDILDMAAAPGGKTTQIAALTNNKAHITACEKNKIRAERLKYNIDKQGASCVFIMQKDARFIDDFFSFDQILLDAPCSGSGTLDFNDNNIEKYFSKQLIDRSSSVQKTLLSKAIKLLKPGHEMVYSTCSILSCENEDIVAHSIKNENVEIKVTLENDSADDTMYTNPKIKITFSDRNLSLKLHIQG